MFPYDRDAFYAFFNMPTPNGGSQAHCLDELGALTLALQAALVQCPAEQVQALLQREMASMLRSLSKVRRAPGQAVQLEEEAGFGATPGRWHILPGEPSSCPLCGNPACQEWPTLARVAEDGSVTDELAYHVSECEMSDDTRKGASNDSSSEKATD